MDLLERGGRGSTKWTPYGFPVKEELGPKLNHEPVSDPSCKLNMGDDVESTSTISDKSLTVYRERNEYSLYYNLSEFGNISAPDELIRSSAVK